MKITSPGTGLLAGALALGLAGLTAGCSSSAHSSCTDLNDSIEQSVQKMTADENDPGAFVTNAQAVAQQLKDKAGSVSDSKVKAAVTNLADDMTSLIAAYQKLQSGDASSAPEIATIASKMEADNQTLTNICK